MAHKLRNLAGQPRKTLTIVLVGARVSAVFFAGLFLFFSGVRSDVVLRRGYRA